MANGGKRRDVAVWLVDGMARLIVGAPPLPEDGTPSRWAIQGVIVDSEVGVGLWLKADTIQDFRPLAKGTKRVNWLFKSSQLLIPWMAALTIQAFDEGAKEMGFTPRTE